MIESFKPVIESMNKILSVITFDRIVASLLVFAVGFVLAHIFRRIIFRTTYKVTPLHVAKAISSFIYYVIVVVTIMTILSIFGVSITGVIVAGGIAGIVLGFASQTVVSNLLAGLFLYWDKPFKPGDPINIEGAAGIVQEISILSTRIQTWDGVYVRIPNEKVFTSTIINYGRMPVRRVELKVSIAYKEDFDKAKEVIMRVLEDHPLVLVYPEPVVFTSELGSDGVEITVQAWAPTSEWINVKRELLWNIKKALTEAGIEIPFPQRDVWFRSPIEVKLAKSEENKK